MTTEMILSPTQIDFSKMPDDVRNYLDKHYPDDRDTLFDALSQRIAPKIRRGEPLDWIEGRVLRAAWETGPINIIDARVNLGKMIDSTGFLTPYERIQSCNLPSGEKGALLYRGCRIDEIAGLAPLGASWTRGKEIAEEFAHVNRGALVSARIPDNARVAWLDTVEKEVLWLNARLDDVITIQEIARSAGRPVVRTYKEVCHG